MPEDYNMLDKSYAEVKGCVCDLEEVMVMEVMENSNEEEESDEKETPEDNHNEVDQFEDEEERKRADKGGKAQKWKISKSVDGRKYLPGKAPLDPKHDIVKFSNVALKSSLKGQKVFDIARVEAIQSCKDGTDVTSFQLKGDSSVRVRFSIYQKSATDDSYRVHSALGLTRWRASSSILGAVELIPVAENTPGCYKLHKSSEKLLKEMGFVCRGDVKLDATEAASSQTTLDEQSEDPLPDDYYEIEDVLQRRLCKDSLTYECKVRFKGYQSDDDMWLPASYFNRAINFESMSMFGRKRKHKIDLDAARDVASKKRRTSSNESQQSMKKGRSTSQESSSFRRCRMQVQETKTAVIKNRCYKGKAGPSSLSAIQGSDTDTPESQEVTSKTSKSKPCRSTLSNSELPSDSHDPLD